MQFRLAEYARNAQAFLLDSVYPRRCAVCGIRGAWVCRTCLATSELFAAPWCDRCGVPVHHPCRCRMIPAAIEQVRSAGPYDGWLRQSIHLIKYQGESSRIDQVAGVALPALLDIKNLEILVPVPLHKQRIKERGFNQSAMLAEALADLIGLDVWDGLVRTRDTPHQVGLDASERASNVAGAFSLRDAFPVKRNVVLVDDVFTTGATLGACAQVLLGHGAGSVSALTIC